MTLPIPSQRTWAVGDIASAAMLNSNVRDAVNFLVNPPLFVGTQQTVQSMPNGWGQVAFDTNVIDTYNGHSTTVNNTRYVAKVPGWYRCGGTVSWPSTSTAGLRVTTLYVNGTGNFGIATTFAASNASGGGSLAVPVQEIVYLNGTTDYVELSAYQSTGAAYSTAVGSRFEVQWIHA